MSKITFEIMRGEFQGNIVEVPLPMFKIKLEMRGRPVDVHFLLDTGSNGTMLFPNSFKRFYPDITFTPETFSETFTLRSLGDRAFNQPLKMRLDHATAEPTTYQEPIMSGIIGQDFLKEYVLDIDYPNSHFELVPAQTYEHTCQYTFHENFLLLHATLAGTPLTLLYDTGAGGVLNLFERGFDKLDKSQFKSDGTAEAEGALGNTYSYDSYDVPTRLQISNELYMDTGFAVMRNNGMTDEAPFDGIIGNDIFLKRKVAIDYPAKRFTFSAALI